MKKKNERKIGIVVMAFMALMVTLAFAGSASADTIYVPTDYPTIQQAIDAASPGDTVFVWNGTYYDADGVKIEKDRITLQGEDANTTTIHGKWAAEEVVCVSGDFVNVSGFTVTGSSSYGSGIYLSHGSCNCRLSRNNATDNYYGILLSYSSNNNLTGNSANNNNYGIYLYHPSNNNLTGNSANNNDYGIYLYSSNNNLTGNSANNNNNYGIYLYHSSNNNLTGNSANNNNYGIYLDYLCNNNNLTGNSANNNDDDGIRLYYSSKNNELKGNTADANSYGIRLVSTSTKNNITENTVSNNTNYGIYLDWSGENEIWHNNFINNNKQARDHYGFNNWDKGPIIGGNHWSDHVCHGNPSNGTEPYMGIDTDAGAVDDYPFQDPNGWFGGNIPPIADFSYSPEKPVVNQTIIFNASNSTDPDGTIENYEWDFGDGNTTSTTEPIITHSYALAGDYTVNLTVTDDDGATDSINKTITVYSPAAIFDTGSPKNPYPSIMGNHTGTIKPNQTVIATKLYTYSCMGTGGHTEYAEIRNVTWNATATWNGYAGDWKNITFDKTVVLLANEEYNYTIRTGSYPQIHHNRTLLTANGWINCTKFTDANGRIYTNWIPAIRLE
jgi:parallel beta-helix repeat protein